MLMAGVSVAGGRRLAIRVQLTADHRSPTTANRKMGTRK